MHRYWGTTNIASHFYDTYMPQDILPNITGASSHQTINVGALNAYALFSFIFPFFSLLVFSLFFFPFLSFILFSLPLLALFFSLFSFFLSLLTFLSLSLLHFPSILSRFNYNHIPYM